MRSLPLTVAKRGLVAGLGVLSVFQVALAAGAPAGRWAYGGAHDGALPPSLRVTSAAAAVGWAGVAGALLRTPMPLSERARTGSNVLAVVLAAAAALNLISRSHRERFAWTPFSIAMALFARRLARHEAADGAGPSQLP